ncbi:MAG: matrixin family metalloprotease [Gemmatimonadota bacterium]
MNARTLTFPLFFGGLGLLPLAGPAEAPAPSLDCEAPLRWRIEAVDPRFGLSELEAADAVRQAGMVWGDGTGLPLLFQESSEGIPIRFVFDERMETALERRSSSAEIDERARAVEEGTSALEASRMELDRRRTAHGRRALDFQERQESHNRTVEYWNRAGGAPPAEFERLRAMEEEIAELRRVVDAELEAVNRVVGEVNREADELNAQITALNEARIALDAELPAGVVESAEYRRSRGGFFSNAAREIDVFHFEDRNHLHRVLAHVLGHAIGLEHSEEPGALMHAAATVERGEGRPRLHEEDIAQFRALCPEL